MSGRRPQGTGQFVCGGFTALFGVAAIVKGLTITVSRYPTIDVDAYTTRWNFLSLGSCCLVIALTLFAVGWVVHAISFLPGKGEPIFSTSEPILELSNGESSEAGIEDDTPSPMAWLIALGGLITLGLIGFLAMAS